MITKQQAVTLPHGAELHYGTCIKTIGPRGGVSLKSEHWRPNGQCRVWVTRPEEFCLPIKYGLKSYAYLTERNAKDFHLATDCNPVECHATAEGHKTYCAAGVMD